MNDMITPKLRKARRVKGRALTFRDATSADATFILSLRTDIKKSKYLSNTSPELERQISWLEDYAKRNDQVYFIIENQSGEALGTVRLYDPQGFSFCWGSWILKDGAPQSAAIESALMVYAYAIKHLGFNQSHFDVRKKNKGVWLFHERFGAERIGETDQDYLYRIGLDEISISQQRYKKFLPKIITVE